MNLENLMIPCLFKALFGIECLGCGFQRAVVLLFKGDFTDAFYRYPAIYMVLIFIALFVLDKVFKPKKYTKALSLVGVVTMVFILGGYIYKNL